MKVQRSNKNCKYCKQEFPNNESYFKGSSCKTCYALFETSLKNAKGRAEKLSRSFNLDESWVHEQYAKQNQQCWWTGQDFDFSPTIVKGVANPNAVSIDRIVNEEGYTKQNSVVCVNWFNKFKSNYSIPELNYMLMGCTSAYAKIQQVFVPTSTVPFHQLGDEYARQFHLPLTQEETDKLLKDLEEGHFEPFGKYHPGTKRLLDDLERIRE